VVLVYDADEGGSTGVDRALELFLKSDVDLAVTKLPDGLDPCDLLSARGSEPFLEAMADAKNVLEYCFELQLAKEADAGIEGTRRTVEKLLGIIALIPEDGENAVSKCDLALTRLSQRFGLRLQDLRARIGKIRKEQKSRSAEPIRVSAEEIEVRGKGGKGPADPLERELLEVLLADPSLVAVASTEIGPDDLEHPGLRRLLRGLYELLDGGETPDLDLLRQRLADNPRLADKAYELQMVGRLHPDRPAWLSQILQLFRDRQDALMAKAVQGQLNAAKDEAAAMELLRLLQQRQRGLDP